MGKLNRHDLENPGNYLDLTLVEAAEVSFTFTGRNRHSFNRIFLVIDENGGDNFIRNHTDGSNQYLPMRKNMIYFMPCNTDLEFSFNTDMRFISFHFHMEIFRHFDVFAGQTACTGVRDERGVTGELSAILNSPDCDLGNICRMRGIVMIMAGYFIGSKQPYVYKLNFLANKYSELFEYIREKADASTTIDDLAEAAKMSRDSLSREFSRDCGITLKQYLTRNLIGKAEKLLLAPETSARSAAKELKFNNEYYFSRFFKKNTGTTTRDYREQMQKNFKS